MLWLPLALLLAPDPGVRWDAPPTCSSPGSIDARLEAANVRVERPVVAHVIPPTPADSATWRLEVRVADTPPRLLEGESCDALADALVAMLSVQARAAVPPPPAPQPTLAPPESAGPPALPAASLPSPPAAAATEAPAPFEPQASPEGSARRSPAVVLGMAAGIHGVGIPGLGGGVGADLGVRFPHLRVGGYGRWWFRRDRAVGPVAASYRLAVGGLEACGVGALGRLEALGCGVAEFGELRARGEGAAPPRTQRHLWFAPGARLGAQWRTRGPLRFGLSAVVLAPLNRRQFSIGDVSAGQIGPVELRALAHIAVSIPTRRSRKRDGR